MVFCFIGFQSPRSYWFMDLVKIHDYNIQLMAFMLMFLGLGFIYFFYNSFFYIQSSSFTVLEFWWTLTPMKIASVLLFPTLFALYSLSFSGVVPLMTLKVIGHQWNWEYELVFQNMSVNFDSFIFPMEKMNMRLLDSFPYVILPSNSIVRVLVTSADVLHSFFIPSLGVKLDAVPGRLSEFLVSSNISGVVNGMCAEICGKGHDSMPISIGFISLNSFTTMIN